MRFPSSSAPGSNFVPVQELIPHNVLSRATVSHVTPMTPNFPSLPVNVPVESLSRWAETAAMILTNPMTAESSAALTTLGDYLASNQWTEAAHAW